MIVINVRNVNEAFAKGVKLFLELEAEGVVVSPRGMRTIEAPEPVATVYRCPRERVLFSEVRDANPFFHFFEALWMLAGRSDVAFPAMLNSRMSTFSDNGTRIWGAYGWRWRSFFGFDQIQELVKLLQKDPSSRRGVLTMWSPRGDMAKDGPGPEGGLAGKDIPCNTHCYFKVRNDALQMTICNRSNDMLWGAYGANAVHMSMLQEYVAGKLGVRVGPMTQVSDSLHVYLDDAGGELWGKVGDKPPVGDDPYAKDEVRAEPMFVNAEENYTEAWDRDLFTFMDKAQGVEGWERNFIKSFHTAYFQDVVVPLWRGWRQRSEEELEFCAAPDWRRAGVEWLRRRKK